MLTKENINPCNNQIYSSSGIVGTTLTYHDDYSLSNSGAIGTTDIWHEENRGTITCNLQNEGSLNNYSLALYKTDIEENSTLLFDAQYKDIGATSFIVNNLDNIEDHKRNHLYIEFRYSGTIKARFKILDVFESVVYRVSFQSIIRSMYEDKVYIQLRDLRVERIRNFDNLYSTIANKANIAVTAKSSNIGLGFFDGLQDNQQEITERRLAVNLMNGATVVQSLLNKTFEMSEDSYEVISFTTPNEIISSHSLRINTLKLQSGSTTPITTISIQIPIHDGTNALLCPNCTYYICFNHLNQRIGTTVKEEEIIDLLSISKYPFTKSIWQSIIEPIVIKGDSQYISAYNDIFIGSTGSTSGNSTQACLFKENIAGETGNNGCDIYVYQKNTGTESQPVIVSLQTYIKTKPVATQTYVVGQAIRACDLLNEAESIPSLTT